MDAPKEYTHKYFLTAGECNAEKEMSVSLLAQRVIEVATEHANILGVGYADLVKENHGWVLSRLTIEMSRFPALNEEYSLTTWIEGFNRLYSERNMEVKDGNGITIGYIRSIWVAIDFDTRKPVDLSTISWLAETISDRPCPIEKQGRMRPLGEADMTFEHRFRYCDIDFNRHVNSVKYIDAILNCWDLDFHDTNSIARFEIMYQREALFGNTVQIAIKQSDNVADAEIFDNNGAITRIKIVLNNRTLK